MKRTQQGMTLIGFILVLAVAGVFIYMGMKLIPMYSEYYAVKKAMEQMSQDAGMANYDAAKIKDLFFRRLYTSYSENVKPENVSLTRRDSGWMMKVDYEVRRPLIANIDVVGRFAAEKEIKRIGD
jgi:Tfp pilus assembly major pilin PilA